MWAHNIDYCKDPSDYAYCTCVTYSCGYSQPNRKNISKARLRGGTAEIDCSSGVSWWLFMGGFLNENPWFHTAIEREYLQAHGFEMFPFGSRTLERNDVLWKSGHTGLYIGNGMQAEAIRDENHDAGYEGTIPGDQDNGETVVRPLTDWEYVLRKVYQPSFKEMKNMTFLFTTDGEYEGAVYFYDGGKCFHVNGPEKSALISAYKKATGNELPFFHLEGGSEIIKMCRRGM